MAGLIKLWHEKHNPPPDLNNISFHGKTVLITGATSGLGFEASIKYLRQGVSTLIIGSRAQMRGQDAKRHLEQITGCSPDIIQVWPLDMSSFQNVINFATTINRSVSRLDIVILNAGVMHRSGDFRSRDGWEDTLQVNTLATTLLALLLLPKLISSSSVLPMQQPLASQLAKEASTPHLVFVSSGSIIRVTEKDLPSSTISGPALLEYLNGYSSSSPETKKPAIRKRYAITKLLLEYAARSIAKQVAHMGPSTNGIDTSSSTSTSTSTNSGNLKVIVNTVKPGFCASSLGREYTSSSWVVRLTMRLFNALFARSSEVGSRVLLSASVQGYESHGRMWKGDGYLEYSEAGALLNGAVGKRLQNKVWEEIVHVLEEQAPDLRTTIDP